MGTGAALIRRSDQGLEGLILEKVNGMPLEKRYVLSKFFFTVSHVLLGMSNFLSFCRVSHDLQVSAQSDCSPLLGTGS